MRSEPAHPVDGRANTADHYAGSDQGDAEFLRGFSPVIRMCKPIGIRPTDQTSIGSRLWSDRSSGRGIAFTSKMGTMPVIDDKVLRQKTLGLPGRPNSAKREAAGFSRAASSVPFMQ